MSRTQLVTLIIFYSYFIGNPLFPSGCYKLRGELNIPYSGYEYDCCISANPCPKKKTIILLFNHQFYASQ